MPLDARAGALESFARCRPVARRRLSRFAARAEGDRRHGLPSDAIHYRAAFGRPLDYYTGLVFEITPKARRLLVGGGRFDRLLTLLGAKKPIPAVGFSLWLDRIERIARRADNDHHHRAALQGPDEGTGAGRFRARRACRQPPGDDRYYRGRVEGRADVEVAFLSASEIAREIGQGSVDFGVTGEDLIREDLPSGETRREIWPASASATPTSWSPCRKSGSMSIPWPTSTTSPPISARATAAGCDRHEILAADPAVLLAAARHPALPHRRKPRRHRRRAGGRLGRHHRRHHLDRLDAAGQSPEGARRRRHPEVAGLPGRLAAPARCRRRSVASGDRGAGECDDICGLGLYF